MIETQKSPTISLTEEKQEIQKLNRKGESKGHSVEVSPTIKTYLLRNKDGTTNQYELISKDQSTLESKVIRIFKPKDIEIFYTDIKDLITKLEISKKALNAENTKLLSEDIHNNILNDIQYFDKKYSIGVISNWTAIKNNDYNKDELATALVNIINELKILCQQYKENSLKPENKFSKFISSIKSALSKFFTAIWAIFFSENRMFFIAIAKNDINKVEELLSKVDINNIKKGFSKLTPLMYAVNKGNLKVIDILIKNNTNLNAKDKKGNTALMHATLHKRLDIIQKLVNSGANIDEQNNMGNTALMLTVLKNSIETANKLITLNANINLTNNRNDTALMLSIYNNNLNFVKKLTAQNADINIKNINGDDAFVCALNKKNINLYIFNHLMTKDNCNIQNKYGKTVTIIFAENNFTWHDNTLNRFEIDVNIKDNHGRTALMHAAITNNIGMLKKLLNHKNTNINMGDNNGETALMYAAMKYNTNALKELLNHKNTNLHVKDNIGFDALKHAISSLRLQSVKTLIKAGANPYSLTDRGRNAYNIAHTERRLIEDTNSLNYWGPFVDRGIYKILNALDNARPF